MRGRKPKPTVQRELDGNPGKRPINDTEPAPPPVDESFDTPPAIVATRPDAAKEWTRLAPMLRRCRQVSEADRAALIACCLEWAHYQTAIAHRTPEIIKAPSGYAMPNPWISISNKALAALVKLWAELGLTPSSRSRVTTDGPGAGGDAFSEFDNPPPLEANPATKH
jgi:P27 family predicted phage terminase small subunit